MAQSEAGTSQPVSVCVLVVMMRGNGSSTPIPIPQSASACAWPWLLLPVPGTEPGTVWLGAEGAETLLFSTAVLAAADLVQKMKGTNAEIWISVKIITST